MGTLSGLPGVAVWELEAPLVRSITGFMGALTSHRAALSSGSYGSCTVWRDDDGNYRCDFQRWMLSYDRQTFTSKRAVKGWLRAWMPKQHVIGAPGAL